VSWFVAPPSIRRPIRLQGSLKRRQQRNIGGELPLEGTNETLGTRGGSGEAITQGMGSFWGSHPNRRESREKRGGISYGIEIFLQRNRSRRPREKPIFSERRRKIKQRVSKVGAGIPVGTWEKKLLTKKKQVVFEGE